MNGIVAVELSLPRMELVSMRQGVPSRHASRNPTHADHFRLQVSSKRLLRWCQPTKFPQGW
ncbi:MAG: hypothetical protein VYC71_04255, partial [Planctomycetota bacterium]|nr:hypothetical protein [Planctomycetota bacterium]